MTRVVDGVQSSEDFRPTISRQRRGWVSVGVLILGLLTVGSTLAADVRDLLTLRSLIPPGHYLILLQNNAELRPSGGFLGTFAVVDVTAMGYRNLSIDTNIYKRDNAFTEHTQIASPAPLAVINGGPWAMRDANWDADFRDAAARVASFYKQEGGEAVDGIIAVNATAIQDLLRLIGPLTLPGESDELLTAETFFSTLHYKIEKEYFYDRDSTITNEPKAILAELVPQLRQRLLTPHAVSRLGPFLHTQLKEKQILFYHTDPAVEERILAHNWGGAIETHASDTLALVNANLTGKKSSLFIRQSVRLDMTSAGEEVTHSLQVERTHTGDGVWPDARNNNYLRVLIPPEATATRLSLDGQSALDGVAVEQEAGRQSLGLWVNTDPHETSLLELTYVTPLPAMDDAVFVYQKQPGVLVDYVRVTYNGRPLLGQMVTRDVTISLPTSAVALP